mgnify:CR=1 FL=1
MKWDLYLNFLAAMLSIVNPIGIVPIWSSLTGDKSRQVRSRVALMVTVTSLVILLVFLVSGKFLLQFFSIDLQVFKIAGGILLLIVGISMINGSATQLSDKEEDGQTNLQVAKSRFRKIMVPMAIPTLAGPGSITTVILFGSSATGLMDYVILFLVLIISLGTLLAVFSYSDKLEHKIDSIYFDVFTRLFGIIVAAIGVQFMVEGLGEVFPAWMEGASELEKGDSDNGTSAK